MGIWQRTGCREVRWLEGVTTPTFPQVRNSEHLACEQKRVLPLLRETLPSPVGSSDSAVWHPKGPPGGSQRGGCCVGRLCGRLWGAPVAKNTRSSFCQVGAPHALGLAPVAAQVTTVSRGAAILGALTLPGGHGARCFVQAAPPGGPGCPVCGPGASGTAQPDAQSRPAAPWAAWAVSSPGAVARPVGFVGTR